MQAPRLKTCMPHRRAPLSAPPRRGWLPQPAPPEVAATLRVLGSSKQPAPGTTERRICQAGHAAGRACGGVKCALRRSEAGRAAKAVPKRNLPGRSAGVTTSCMQHRSRFLGVLLTAAALHAAAADLPNILWITSEDNGPHLGCYGDAYATTPHLDALAAKGTIYLHAWSAAPVCAPARTTIISGVYPPALGAEHMRSMVPLPPGLRLYPQFLREAGYYCTNNSKEDYNVAQPPGVWDESSGRAHWRNRAPGQPFFAIFNFTTTHESQIRKRPHQAVHDPAGVRIPAYHPDTPETRRDWAQYYDKITEMDAQAGKLLADLESDGLTANTIIVYFGDHGPGMPRSKRWPYNSGLQVPLIVHIPDRFAGLRPPDYAPAGRSSRLVSFVDLAPTMLALAGIHPPAWMQGRAFLGPFTGTPRPFMYGFRGRMDERYDLVRTVTDGRYVYLRQYLPHKPYGQHVAYMFETPTTQIWKTLNDEGKLNDSQSRFWQTKPPEELYDLITDPDETRNLADSPEHREILLHLRQAEREQVFAIRDLGFLPENEIHSRSAGSTPYEIARDPAAFPLGRIHAAADLASRPGMGRLPAMRRFLADPDSAVRYWGATGLLIRGPEAVRACEAQLRLALGDPAPAVRVAASEALGKHGDEEDSSRAIRTLLELSSLDDNDVWTCTMALNAIDAMGVRAHGARARLEALPAQGGTAHNRYANYVPRLLKDLLGQP